MIFNIAEIYLNQIVSLTDVKTLILYDLILYLKWHIFSFDLFYFSQLQLILIFKFSEQVIPLVRSFSATWRKSVEKLNNEVMQCFTNFRTGTVVLQRALEALITAHHSFNRVIGHQIFSHLNIKADIVNSHHLIVEAKKYKPTF